MKLRLRENLFFELKIQLKNYSIYVVKLSHFPPACGRASKFWRRGTRPGTGDMNFWCGRGARGQLFFLLPGGSKLYEKHIPMLAFLRH